MNGVKLMDIRHAATAVNPPDIIDPKLFHRLIIRLDANGLIELKGAGYAEIIKPSLYQARSIVISTAQMTSAINQKQSEGLNGINGACK